MDNDKKKKPAAMMRSGKEEEEEMFMDGAIHPIQTYLPNLILIGGCYHHLCTM